MKCHDELQGEVKTKPEQIKERHQEQPEESSAWAVKNQGISLMEAHPKKQLTMLQKYVEQRLPQMEDHIAFIPLDLHYIRSQDMARINNWSKEEKACKMLSDCAADILRTVT
nr:unnamed protein product [Callosobruchus chinensis]